MTVHECVDELLRVYAAATIVAITTGDSTRAYVYARTCASVVRLNARVLGWDHPSQ